MIPPPNLTGDDTLVIRPEDPMFYPGPFYIGVYGIYDSDFTVLHRQIL